MTAERELSWWCYQLGGMTGGPPNRGATARPSSSSVNLGLPVNDAWLLAEDLAAVEDLRADAPSSSATTTITRPTAS